MSFVVLINPLEVPSGQGEVFFKQWHALLVELKTTRTPAQSVTLFCGHPYRYTKRVGCFIM
jgi:hypothetical protein